MGPAIRIDSKQIPESDKEDTPSLGFIKPPWIENYMQ